MGFCTYLGQGGPNYYVAEKTGVKEEGLDLWCNKRATGTLDLALFYICHFWIVIREGLLTTQKEGAMGVLGIGYYGARGPVDVETDGLSTWESMRAGG